jgi:hypothetical protein
MVVTLHFLDFLGVDFIASLGHHSRPARCGGRVCSAGVYFAPLFSVVGWAAWFGCCGK